MRSYLYRNWLWLSTISSNCCRWRPVETHRHHGKILPYTTHFITFKPCVLQPNVSFGKFQFLIFKFWSHVSQTVTVALCIFLLNIICTTLAGLVSKKACLTIYSQESLSRHLLVVNTYFHAHNLCISNCPMACSLWWLRHHHNYCGVSSMIIAWFPFFYLLLKS